MYLFQRIEDVILEHNDARRGIGEFILHEKSKICQYTMKEVADFTYTSKSTLVRFAKTLGYKGWNEFLIALEKEIRYEEAHTMDIDSDFPFAERDATSDIKQKLKQLQIESIMDTASMIDERSVDQAIDIMLAARRIVIFGIQPNSYLAEVFQWHFLSIGVQITVTKSGEAGMSACSLTKDDCAIIISYSGNSLGKEPVSQVDILKSRSVPMIGLTSGGTNYIRENVNCVLSISSRERLYTKISNFATEQSILYLLNMLYSCYFQRNYQKNLQYKVNNSKLLESQRKTALKQISENEN